MNRTFYDEHPPLPGLLLRPQSAARSQLGIRRNSLFVFKVREGSTRSFPTTETELPEPSRKFNWKLNSVSQRKRRSSGFTLVELLLVVACVAVLIALLLPAVQQSREAARRTQCRNNLMQIGIALQNYSMVHNVLPPGTQNDTGPIQSKEKGGYHMGWLTQILPYLEEKNAYDQIDFDQTVYDPSNLAVRSHPIATLQCPSEVSAGATTAASTNYCGIHNDFESPIDVDQNGVLFLNSSIHYEKIRDGSSNTAFVVETRLDSNLGWMSGTRSSLRNLVVANPPANSPRASGGGAQPPTSFSAHNSTLVANQGPPSLRQEFGQPGSGREFVGGPSSFHPGGFQVAMGDGAVRFFSLNTSPMTLRNLAHRADGEMPDEF